MAELEYPWRPLVYVDMRDDHLVGEGRLFEPDVMLPAQYFTLLRKQAPQGPEYLLVIAMLQDAIECFQKHRSARDENGRQLFEDARDWIESDDRRWPFSFENVCALLNLHAGYIRRGLQEWADRQAPERPRAKVLPLKAPARPVVDPADAATVAARAS